MESMSLSKATWREFWTHVFKEQGWNIVLRLQWRGIKPSSFKAHPSFLPRYSSHNKDIEDVMDLIHI